LSINWGGWSEVGLVARRTGASEIFAMRGFESMPPDQCLALLEQVLRHDRPQVAVMSTNWAQVCDAYPQIGRMPFFTKVVASQDARSRSTVGRIHVLPRSELLAMVPADRENWLRMYLCAHLAKTLGITSNEIEVQRPINTMGIDSLMALEMKNRIETELGVTLPIVKFLEGANTTEIASLLLQELESTQPREQQLVHDVEIDTADPKASTIDSAQAAQILVDIDKLSDAEVDSLLASLNSSEVNS
jgi:myxalamid-type polyketide synthase MxaB